jgi:hypothetical protein
LQSSNIYNLAILPLGDRFRFWRQLLLFKGLCLHGTFEVFLKNYKFSVKTWFGIYPTPIAGLIRYNRLTAFISPIKEFGTQFLTIEKIAG